MSKTGHTLLPTSLVGSYAQPDWLIDREKLAGRFPPRTRARELWRVAPEFLAQAQDDATLVAILVPSLMLGGILLLMLVLGCCCGAAAGAPPVVDCREPPDRTKDPAAYARWQRECERKRVATGAHGEGVQLLRILS